MRGPRCLCCGEPLPNAFGLRVCPVCSFPFDLDKVGKWVIAAQTLQDRISRQITQLTVQEGFSEK